MAITKSIDNGIVTLTIDVPGKTMNVINDSLVLPLAKMAEEITADIDNIKGVIITSAKKDFIAGADIDALFEKNTAEDVFVMVEALKTPLRQLETLGKPVVAAINGTALGGGYEVTLAAHHRIAINHPKIQIGLPETKIGAFPGGGGTFRLPRMIGMQNALPIILEGKTMNPEKALAAGLVDELATDINDMLAKAKAWIEANPNAQQPWDQKGFRFPGGDGNNPKVVQMLAIAPAMLHQKTWGNYPAPAAALRSVVEGSRVDVDTASLIESRLFAEIISGQVCKNMMNAFWFELNAIKRGASRPNGTEKQPVKKLGVLGAGLMGAGIAYESARAGIDVVLKDVSVENAEKGKQYFADMLQKKIARKRMTEEKAAAILDKIKPTADYADLDGCDLVVEAVFEDRKLKAQVTQDTEAVIPETAVFASNTSTLPITGLAEPSSRPANFIGLHFFSPVERMPLVEIIVGEKTSDATLAKAFDYVLQIRKTPIVVNDSRGFYTSRVFATYINEGMNMLAEGVHPQVIETAGLSTGMPVAPLALTDEVAISLAHHIMQQTKADLEAAGLPVPDMPAQKVVIKMVEELNRPGKRAGKGFYDYDGKQKKLWTGLAEQFPTTQDLPMQDIKDRLLYIQANETAKCFEENVVTQVADANIGSIFGWGFAPWSGGALRFINATGVQEFVARSQQLAEQYGERFAPAKVLVEMANSGKTF